MPKFRKKPVVIEATQYVHDHGGHGNYDEVADLVDGWKDLDTPFIATLEGEMIVSNGDWIITGVKGERYPCKPDIFEATYDPVD
jgi:hypothetical protein